MYISTTLAESPSTAVYVRPFDSAGRNITEADAPHILTILAGGPEYFPGDPSALSDEAKKAATGATSCGCPTLPRASRE